MAAERAHHRESTRAAGWWLLDGTEQGRARLLGLDGGAVGEAVRWSEGQKGEQEGEAGH